MLGRLNAEDWHSADPAIALRPQTLKPRFRTRRVLDFERRGGGGGLGHHPNPNPATTPTPTSITAYPRIQLPKVCVPNSSSESCFALEYVLRCLFTLERPWSTSIVVFCLERGGVVGGGGVGCWGGEGAPTHPRNSPHGRKLIQSFNSKILDLSTIAWCTVLSEARTIINDLV